MEMIIAPTPVANCLQLQLFFFKYAKKLGTKYGSPQPNQFPKLSLTLDKKY